MQNMKINVFNICLMILNSIFWILIAAGALWLVFLVLAGFFNVSSYGFSKTLYEFIGMLAAYAVIYTLALLGVICLRRYIKKLADKKDGKEPENKPLNIKKEVTFWVSLCFGLIIASELAGLWMYFVSLFLSWFMRP